MNWLGVGVIVAASNTGVILIIVRSARLTLANFCCEICVFFDSYSSYESGKDWSERPEAVPKFCNVAREGCH